MSKTHPCAPDDEVFGSKVEDDWKRRPSILGFFILLIRKNLLFSAGSAKQFYSRIILDSLSKASAAHCLLRLLAEAAAQIDGFALIY